ncbi:DUF3152 domain-containing protein [Streptomyces coffeae]|uniref:DUF3152 domain-containing protein n=1 Tax=Streptomyces coffeae TaxID=621382 RepID=UPI0027DDDA30|nr:DUF3152 domain-containing protein [Streptomyces coffeae]
MEHNAPGAAGAPSGAPGTGRRRRAAPGAADPAMTPPQGVPRAAYGPQPPPPRARGGHPEHHEPGGGWGALGGPRASAGATTMNPPSRPTVSGAGGLMPGPRKEYLDAFGAPGAMDDGEDVFAAGAPGAVPTPRRAREAAGAGADGGSSDEYFPGNDADHDADGPGDDDPEDGARGGTKGGRGRTFTGVAAAAVTTVLAVVVAGQVAGGSLEDKKQPRAQGGAERGRSDNVSRGDDRPAPAQSAGARAHLSYSEKMAAVFPLDPKLRGPGAFTTVGGHDKAPGRGEVLRYRVDVEKGLPLDGELFAEAVHKTLNDDRSWGHGGRYAFERVSSGPAKFVITLASPGTTAAWCAKSGLDVAELNVSCDSAQTSRVMINAYRWARGAETFGDDKMHSYRQMLINHEVGHRLGHNHEVCGRDGALAPVMMQQTKFLSTDGATCRPNAWPFPKR